MTRRKHIHTSGKNAAVFTIGEWIGTRTERADRIAENLQQLENHAFYYHMSYGIRYWGKSELWV